MNLLMYSSHLKIIWKKVNVMQCHTISFPEFAACLIVNMVFFCFLDAQPTDAERETWNQVDVVLKDARAVLDELQAYNGAVKEIREVHTGPLLLIQILHFLINKTEWQILKI